jgi:hypothetical protein
MSAQECHKSSIGKKLRACFLSLLIGGFTAICTIIGTRARFSINKKKVDLEKFSMRFLYLMKYWMDWDDCTGKYDLFHEEILNMPSDM